VLLLCFFLLLHPHWPTEMHVRIIRTILITRIIHTAKRRLFLTFDFDWFHCLP
jgi:hypothetical protein